MSNLNIRNLYFSVLVNIMDWFNMQADLLINLFIRGLFNFNFMHPVVLSR